MRKRLEKIIFLFLTAVIIFATHLYITFYTPATWERAEPKTINIQKGASFRTIAEGLEKAGVIRDSESFIFAATLLGKYKKVKAGEYEFTRPMTSLDVLDFLVKGRIKKYLVTIPEGCNIREVASLLMGAGLAQEEEFVSKATDARFVASLGFDGQSFEGYLFPDTYEVSKGMSPEEIIIKMVEKFKAVYYPELDAIARARGMSTKKAVTLASIIEKETGAPEERGLVSAVFHNRLKKGIKLQSDPTAVYGVKDFNGNITKRHLQANTPYNTYVNYGLPPGPIANPGKASLKAALNPANEDFIYFVSKNDGTHHFSKNLREHTNAVNHYQRSQRPL